MSGLARKREFNLSEDNTPPWLQPELGVCVWGGGGGRSVGRERDSW